MLGLVSLPTTVDGCFSESGRINPAAPVKTDADGRLQLRFWQGERWLSSGSA